MCIQFNFLLQLNVLCHLKYNNVIKLMLFTDVALKTLSNGTIVVCFKLRQNEGNTTKESESEESVKEHCKEQKEEKNEEEAQNNKEESKLEESIEKEEQNREDALNTQKESKSEESVKEQEEDERFFTASIR